MLRFALVLPVALCAAAPASAQTGSPGPLEDLVGTYPLRATQSSQCDVIEDVGTFEVRSVDGANITIALNGSPVTGAFDSAARSFRMPFATPLGEVVLEGRFTRQPTAVDAALAMIFPQTFQCEGTPSREGRTVRVAGTKPAPALAAAEAPTAGEEAGAPEPAREGEDEGPAIEPIPEWIPLLLAFLLFLAVGAGLAARAKRRRRAAGGVGGLAGRAGMIAGGIISPSVGSDRFGGFEDGNEYGEGAGVASPASSRAHEALVVAQAPQADPGQPLERRPPRPFRPTGSGFDNGESGASSTAAEGTEESGEGGDPPPEESR